jgi:hypothetical protein
MASVSPHSVLPLLPLVIVGSNTMANINFVRLDVMLIREERINTPA